MSGDERTRADLVLRELGERTARMEAKLEAFVDAQQHAWFAHSSDQATLREEFNELRSRWDRAEGRAQGHREATLSQDVATRFQDAPTRQDWTSQKIGIVVFGVLFAILLLGGTFVAILQTSLGRVPEVHDLPTPPAPSSLLSPIDKSEREEELEEELRRREAELEASRERVEGLVNQLSAFPDGGDP